MTVTINGTTGIAGVDGSAGTPAVQGADTNTGIFFPAADTIAFAEGGVEAARINSSGVFTTTNDATIQGLTVGRGGGAVATNIAFGQYVLNSNTSGSRNIGVGQQSLFVNTTGASNTALGVVALVGNTTGGLNTAVGDSALYSNTTASNNTAVGYQAAFSGTTGATNTAIGYQAGYSGTTAEQAVYVGFQAGYNTTTSVNNVAVGYQSLLANTTGQTNTAIGHSALKASTTANDNTAVGYQAGNASTLASLANFFGYRAGYNFNVNNADCGTCFIGSRAGFSTTTGTKNTFLGEASGYAVTTGSGHTILGRYDGNQGGLDIRTASNYIVLSDGDGNPRGVFDSSGNLLVGTTDATKGALIVGKAAPSAAYGQICALSPTASDSATSGMSIVKFANDSTTAQVLFRFLINQGAAGQGQINANGASAAAFGSYSDSRLKENIVNLPSQLANIMALRPVEFDYIESEGGGHQLGFIAQEVQAIYPDLVGERKDGMLTLSDMNKNDARLIKAIQEQQALITTLTARITALENK
jgi:hypothetical protein